MKCIKLDIADFKYLRLLIILFFRSIPDTPEEEPEKLSLFKNSGKSLFKKGTQSHTTKLSVLHETAQFAS